MKKEIIVCCVILLFIIVFHVITQTTSQNYFDGIIKELDEIEEKIFSKNSEKEELVKDIDSILEKWRANYGYYACFIEHDELEKVQTQLISMRANIKTGDLKKCMDESEKCKFILKHIEDKDAMKIVNIF
ncbi:MAG: DUF4363 family protein [Clostridia bacterium]|nr:DUF4363 family protein [Clostridia bacterium]MBR4261671.1 DUF4363 family protein [Clostridia bacterium]